MADVRSLLRNERAARRIAHPAASYTEAGKLLCNVCALQIKNEAQWDSHIKSPQHSRLVQQTRDNPPLQGRKRKAGDDDDESHKRVKGVPDGFFQHPDPDVEAVQGEYDATDAPVDAIVPDSATSIQDPALQTSASAAPVLDVDEDEWAAFEADLAATQAVSLPISAAATISAAPMTAEQIAAQAREEQSTQRGRREAEIEAEKEDADQALQDEFDEMEELEVRVRKLREKREALRRARDEDDELLPDVVDPMPTVIPSSAATKMAEEVDDDDDDDDDEDDDDDDDFDDWKFGSG